MQDHFFIWRIIQFLSVVHEGKFDCGKNYIGEKGYLNYEHCDIGKNSDPFINFLNTG